MAELIIFDRETGPGRYQWQVFRRAPGQGLVRAIATNADRVRSRVLGCWLRAVGEGASLRVRIATGSRGDDLARTSEEIAHHAEEIARDAQLAQARAEEEAARLRLELARLAGTKQRAAKRKPRR